MVEHHLAMVGVAGSNPVFRFHRQNVLFMKANIAKIAGVAELADAQDLKSCGEQSPYRFDSDSRHLFAPMAQLDRVLDYESSGCRFESCWVHCFS